MVDYYIGYDYYKKACQEYGLKPINFAFYILSLSKDQLDIYNERAKQNWGHNLEN